MDHPPTPKGTPATATAPDDGDQSDESDGAVEVREAVVGAAWHGWRLDKALVAMADEFSRSHLQTLVADGVLRIDGVVQRTASRKLRAGQRLALELRPTEESRAFVAQPMALAIVYEDPHLLVLNKPPGLVVHPAAGNWSGTLLNGLLAHHPAAATLPRAGIVHRLDKDTSGLMVVGKTLPAVTALARGIAARAVRRHYLALAHGVLGAPRAGHFRPATHGGSGRVAAPRLLESGGWQSVEAPLARDPASRVRMAVVAGGRPARTDVLLLARRDEVSALACRLHSGRTHQIRVHLAFRGHPLIGDALYGGHPALGMARQALHAAQLQLAHPVSGEPLSFDAEAPPDFTAAWLQVTGSTPRWNVAD